MALPLEPTDVPGIYRRGSKFVVVYRAEGRQHKQSVTTFAEAGTFKLRRDGEARAMRRGPMLHEFSLSCSTARRHTCRSNARSSRARSSRPGHATAPD